VAPFDEFPERLADDAVTDIKAGVAAFLTEHPA